jgi:3-dehydroquinate synthetase
MSDVIARSVGLKAAVVGRDERESGLRRALNLGHTIGHAVEAASGFAVPHGFAVAIGIAVESAISVRLGLMAERDRRRIVDLLRRFGLPTAIPPRMDRAAFRKALAMDQKGPAAGPGFTLPVEIGTCALGVAVDPTIIAGLSGVGA